MGQYYTSVYPLLHCFNCGFGGQNSTRQSGQQNQIQHHYNLLSPQRAHTFPNAEIRQNFTTSRRGTAMTATCLHCKKRCRLTRGAEIYPHRKELANKPMYKCDPCNAVVGCHPGGGYKPLGFAANKKTRQARMQLHNQRLDPLWKYIPNPKQRRHRRTALYKFLSKKMGLTAEETHTGMFTIEQCREAWRHLGKFYKVG